MKNEFIYERRQLADRMGSVMIIVSGAAALAAVWAFLQAGLLSGAAFLILAAIAFALSQVLSLISDIFATLRGLIGNDPVSGKPMPPGDTAG